MIEIEVNRIIRKECEFTADAGSPGIPVSNKVGGGKYEFKLVNPAVAGRPPEVVVGFTRPIPEPRRVRCLSG